MADDPILTQQWDTECDGGFSIEWTTADQTAALAEGWFLDEDDGRLMRDDCPDDTPPTFEDDGCALQHVSAKAKEGSELHIKAMIFHAAVTLDAWRAHYESEIGPPEF